MLEKARALKVGIGVTFNLADCHEKIGRTASAWAGFLEAAAAADVAGQPERALIARERAAGLVPKLSLLRIVVSAEAASAPDLDVQREGVSLGRLLWGKSVPVNPGEYVISATATGRATWNTLVSVEKPGEVVSIDVPILKPTQGSDLGIRNPAARAPSAADGNHEAIPTAIVLGSAITSLIALEIGVGFTVAANGQSLNVSAIREALGGPSACYGPLDPAIAGRCNGLKDAATAWDTFTNAAIASYVVSGLTAIGAVAAHVWWPRRRAKPEIMANPWVHPRGAGLSATGTF
jgi:hypothetical protein